MKRTAILSLALCFPWDISAHVLTNPMLKAADQAGLFNQGIVDVLRVRKKIKDFISGKLTIHAALCKLNVVDADGNAQPQQLDVMIRRPEAIFGATFIVITHDHPDIKLYQTAATTQTVQKYIASFAGKSLLSRYETVDTRGVATGLFALHPITQEALPVYISDYILEGLDTRSNHCHLAIPAHDQKDFEFAQAHKLPVKMVINTLATGKTSSPQINKATGQLTSAYAGDYDDSFVCNSDFVSGPIHQAAETVLSYLSTNNLGTPMQKNLVYAAGSKQYSIHELSMIENTLQKENRTLSSAQQELFKIILLQAHADFLTLVEQFLVNARDAKELMIQLIDESCAMRNTPDAYLLKWAHMKTTESEKTIFKRDINSMTKFYHFGSELADFLGDFASSCPTALEVLKNLKHS